MPAYEFGDIVLVPRAGIVPTGLSIEDGIRIILSAGTAAPPRLPTTVRDRDIG